MFSCTYNLRLVLMKGQIKDWPPNLTTTCHKPDAVPTLPHSASSCTSPLHSAYPRHFWGFPGDRQCSPASRQNTRSPDATQQMLHQRSLHLTSKYMCKFCGPACQFLHKVHLGLVYSNSQDFPFGSKDKSQMTTATFDKYVRSSDDVNIG